MKKILLPMLFMCFLLNGCGNSDDDRIRMPFGSGSYSNMNYSDAISKLEEAGFTNIKCEGLGDLITGWIHKEGEIKSITVDGYDTFSGDSKFFPDVPIIISYHSFDKNEDTSERVEEQIEKEENSDGKETPIQNSSSSDYVEHKQNAMEESTAYFHSSNHYGTAQKGNSGVFAYEYKDKTKYSTHYRFWVIDFDEGYAYHFADDESTCDKVKITSGDLNDKIIVTYSDGDTRWSYGLHFRFKNRPDALIMQDINGAEYKYTPTGLDEALNIRDSKRTINY